jgi:hypothetical protein
MQNVFYPEMKTLQPPAPTLDLKPLPSKNTDINHGAGNMFSLRLERFL